MGLQTMPQNGWAKRQGVQRAAVILCLAVVIAMLGLQVAHAHPGKSAFSYQNDCSICVGLRQSSAAFCVILLLFALAPEPKAFFPSTAHTEPPVHHPVLALFIRPPPAFAR